MVKMSARLCKPSLVGLSLLLTIASLLFWCSNVKDILAFYTVSDGEPLSLSIKCNVGRLGNQMCSYAVLMGLAALNRRPAAAPACLDDALAGVFPFTSIPRTSRLFVPWKAWPVASYLRPEDGEIPADSNLLTGFSFPCSYTFFGHVADQIRREFVFPAPVMQFARDVLTSTNVGGRHDVIYVGVHVRRGDYQKRWLDLYEGVAVNMRFFRRAFAHFRAKYRQPLFLAVSDDREWCTKHLEPLGAIVAPTAPSAAHDLALLASCNHSIITYGTFGFWGAYLAGGETVFFDKFLKPDTEFARRDFVREKMYPPGWTGIVTVNESDFDVLTKPVRGVS